MEKTSAEIMIDMLIEEKNREFFYKHIEKSSV